MNPDDLKYTQEHEWIRIEGEIATIGITDHAQDELGDVVYVELPPAGKVVEEGQAFGTVESVKAVSELFSPVSGEVTGTNTSLEESPELVNSDPYGKGWMITVRILNQPASGQLLSRTEYEAFLTGGKA